MAAAFHTLIRSSIPGLLAGGLLAGGTVLAADPSARRTVVEPVPAKVSDIHRVSAEATPSGFTVPRFVSLKFGKVNARTGPSRDHPIAYQYQRRGLPLVVVAETEMWRKVRDIHGDEAWVRKPALSGERRAIALATLPLRAKPTDTARTVARLEKGAVVELDDCNADGFCRIRTEGGLKGWGRRYDLWGAQAID